MTSMHPTWRDYFARLLFYAMLSAVICALVLAVIVLVANGIHKL